MIKKIDEYFIYNDKGIESAGLSGTGVNQGIADAQSRRSLG